MKNIEIFRLISRVSCLSVIVVLLQYYTKNMFGWNFNFIISVKHNCIIVVL
jgi:hypothetical protein